MKRSVTLSALCAGVLVIGAIIVFAPRACGSAKSAPDHIVLTWTGDPATTQTITWRDGAAITKGAVRYQAGTDVTATAQSVDATGTPFTTDLGTSEIFTATLTGLMPDTQYSYEVGDGTSFSAAHTFSTEDPKATSVKFLIFGDSQSAPDGKDPYGVWRTTIHNAFAANPDAKFAVNMGDLVDTGQSGAHWNGWFAGAAGVIDTIPQMPVEGNHETYGITGQPKPTYYLAQFAFPQNGPTDLKGQAYYYDYGPMHCVVLDSQGTEEQQYGDTMAEQRTWLDSALGDSKAAWNFVFFHKTPYDIKVNRANPDVKAAFCPTIEKYHADVVFNGHDHGVAWTYPIKDGKLMNKPSQGTVYYTTGRSGTKTYTDLEKKAYDEFFYDPLDQPDYLVVVVSGTRLTITAKKQDGTLIDTMTLDKGADSLTDTPASALPKG